MRLHRLNNAVHRDLGYFLAGTAVLYALSGLALNHVNDWNPNFIVKRQEVRVTSPGEAGGVTRQWINEILDPLGEQSAYRSHDFPTPSKLKIYLDDGSVSVDLAAGRGLYESVRRRPLFYRINCLHLNPKKAWLVFSDFFAVSLLVVCVTGLFVHKGRKGITGRGALITAAGVIIPLVFLYAL